MFNTTNNNSSTTFNAPATGIVQKSNPKSFFLRMHQNSKLAEKVFDEKARYNGKDIVVLQVLLTHECWFLVEIVEADKL